MGAKSEPLVSVVTPVYNGEKYLARCVESVLAQAYGNIEYTIVNNCSTDRTLDIARYYAGKDDRIRVIDNTDFLTAIANHNHALRQISPHSRYCKIVHADDWLFPNCIAEMVGLGRAHPSIGLIACYAVTPGGVRWDGIPYPSTFVPGREICRSALLGGPYVFGPPTTVLIRSDLIHERHSFYNEAHVYADTESCYDILRNADFGFVHQVLCYVRTHIDSLTSSVAARLNTYMSSRLSVLMRYGPAYLTQQEYEARVRHILRDYYVFLGKSVFHFRDRKFWTYHAKELRDCGHALDIRRLLAASLGALGNVLFNPKIAVEKIVRRLHQTSR